MTVVHGVLADVGRGSLQIIKDQTNSEWVIPLRTQVYECIRPNNSQQYPPKTIPYYITAHSSNAPNFSAGK